MIPVALKVDVFTVSVKLKISVPFRKLNTANSASLALVLSAMYSSTIRGLVSSYPITGSSTVSSTVPLGNAM